MVKIFAITATVILTGLTIFQIMLISGKPYGRFAWGGKHLILPTKLRLASVFSIILYTLFAFVMLEISRVTNYFSNDRIIKNIVFILTIYFFIGVIMNLLSRSRSEKLAMTPVAIVLFLLSVSIYFYS